LIENATMAFSRGVVPADAGSSNTCSITSLRLASCSKRCACTDAQYTQPLTRDSTVAPSSRSARGMPPGANMIALKAMERCSNISGWCASTRKYGEVRACGLISSSAASCAGVAVSTFTVSSHGFHFSTSVVKPLMRIGASCRGLRGGQRLEARDEADLVREKGDQLAQRHERGRRQPVRRQRLHGGAVALDRAFDELAGEVQHRAQARVGERGDVAGSTASATAAVRVLGRQPSR
jgi:hypothetical protein